MSDRRQITCQHLGCTCPVAEDFCSEACREHAGEFEDETCGCGHDACDGSVERGADAIPA